MSKQTAKILLVAFAAIFAYNKLTAGPESPGKLDFITTAGSKEGDMIRTGYFFWASVILIPWSLYTIVKS